MTPIPSQPSATIDADCAACLHLLDDLLSSIFSYERQLIDVDPAVDPNRHRQIGELHAEFCRCLGERVAQINQLLATLVEAVTAATPDQQARHAFLCQALQDINLAYQAFCQASMVDGSALAESVRRQLRH